MDEFLAELGSQPLISTLLHFNRMGKTSTIFHIPGAVTGIDKNNIPQINTFSNPSFAASSEGDGQQQMTTLRVPLRRSDESSDPRMGVFEISS
jgi:hypothetical protein